MELQYFGSNCIRITTKKTSLVVDDNLADFGLKSIVKGDDVALRTSNSGNFASGKLNINQPGEYEVGDLVIIGVGARAFGDDQGETNSTIYKIESDEVGLCVIGHVFPEITDNELEKLGPVDILTIPVGGGSTLNGSDALKLIKKIEPKVVIPTYYYDSDVKYPVPQSSIEDALKEMAIEPQESLAKIKFKASDFNEDDPTRVVILER